MDSVFKTFPIAKAVEPKTTDTVDAVIAEWKKFDSSSDDILISTIGEDTTATLSDAKKAILDTHKEIQTGLLQAKDTALETFEPITSSTSEAVDAVLEQKNELTTAYESAMDSELVRSTLSGLNSICSFDISDYLDDINFLKYLQSLLSAMNMGDTGLFDQLLACADMYNHNKDVVSAVVSGNLSGIASAGGSKIYNTVVDTFGVKDIVDLDGDIDNMASTISTKTGFSELDGILSSTGKTKDKLISSTSIKSSEGQSVFSMDKIKSVVDTDAAVEYFEDIVPQKPLKIAKKLFA